MLGLAHRGFALQHPQEHLCHTLKQAGYQTALAGVQHVARLPFSDPSQLGYDCLLSQDDTGGERDVRTVASAVRFLERVHARPFFLDVGFYATHRIGADSFSGADTCTMDPRYVGVPKGIPDLTLTRSDMAGFLGSLSSLDTNIGKVLTALDRAGLGDKTLVICTTDHGMPFPGMKCTLTDRGTGVFLIMRGPSCGRGLVYDSLVSQVDLFPTLCEVLGVDPPEWLQGRSLVPILRGDVFEVHEAIFGEITFHSAYEPVRSVRTARYKYIRRFSTERIQLSNVDDSPSKTILVKAGWTEQCPQIHQLYDLTLDPDETRSVFEDPRYASARADLGARLNAWMNNTRDPLLTGHVKRPSDARITTFDD